MSEANPGADPTPTPNPNPELNGNPSPNADDGEAAPAAMNLGEAVALLDDEDKDTAVTAAEVVMKMVFGNEMQKMMAGQGGAIPGVIRAMGRHGSDADAALKFCKLLRNLSFGVMDNVALAATSGGVVALASALRAHPGDAGVVAEAVWALGVLGRHPAAAALLPRLRADVDAALALHAGEPQIVAKGMYLTALIDSAEAMATETVEIEVGGAEEGADAATEAAAAPEEKVEADAAPAKEP
mmetsp:Transcript_12724/g.38184  ORF Transcript_12724/g.38184 Transcript_12724/m.38184 type:complete len:241 (-) Transcript_12724:47-769(-)